MLFCQLSDVCKLKAARTIRFFQPPLYNSVSTNEKYQDLETDAAIHDEELGKLQNNKPDIRSRTYSTLSWLFSGLFFMGCSLMFVTGLRWKQNFESRCYETANFYCKLLLIVEGYGLLNI